MFACFGFGNLFHQAGLFPPSAAGGGAAEPALLSAISTTSGGEVYSFMIIFGSISVGSSLLHTKAFPSAHTHFHILPATISPSIYATIPASWYSTQLFYSQPFYDATVTSSPEDLRDFVDLWLDSYANLTARASASLAGSNVTAICQDLPDVDDGNLISICELVIAYGGDWASFIEDMLYETSVAFGDADFATRTANAQGRIGPLQNVDLITQTGLTPTARELKEGSADAYVYVGPTAESYYTTPIPASYVVTSDDATPIKGWWIGPAGSELLVSNPMAPDNSSGFDFSDWDEFDLFPPVDDASTTAPRTDAFGRPLLPAEPFQEPFSTSGATSIVQAAATSSALLGSFSGLAPSVFAQSLSLARYRIENDSTLSLVKKEGCFKCS